MLGPLATVLSPVQSTVRKKLQLIMTIIAGKLQDGKYPYCCYTASQWLSILRKTAKRLQLFLWNRDHPSQPCQMLTMLCTFLMKTSHSSSIVRYCALLFFLYRRFIEWSRRFCSSCLTWSKSTVQTRRRTVPTVRRRCIQFEAIGAILI